MKRKGILQHKRAERMVAARSTSKGARAEPARSSAIKRSADVIDLMSCVNRFAHSLAVETKRRSTATSVDPSPAWSGHQRLVKTN